MIAISGVVVSQDVHNDMVIVRAIDANIMTTHHHDDAVDVGLMANTIVHVPS